jgi:hypothetical protein
VADMQKDTPQVGGAGTTSGETAGTPRVYEFPTGDEGVIRVPIHYSSLTMPASFNSTPHQGTPHQGTPHREGGFGAIEQPQQQSPHVSRELGSSRSNPSEFKERPPRRAD